MAVKVERPWGWELVWAVKPTTMGRVLHIRRGNRFWLETVPPPDSVDVTARAARRDPAPEGPDTDQVVLCAGLLMVVWENALGQLEEAVLRPGEVPLERVASRHRMIALEDVAVLAITPSARAELVHIDDS